VPVADDRAGDVAAPRTHRRLAVAFVILLLAFAVLAALVGVHAGGGVDGRIITWFEHHRVDPLNSAGLVFARAGVWWVLGCAAVVLAVVLARRGRRRAAGYLVATMVASASLNLLLKVTIRRTPPGGVPDVIHPSKYAFPSGHTMSATALAAALVIIAWPTRWRWPVLAGSGLFAFGMGLSRMYLAVHCPSDVAAGWAMGVTVALGVRLLFPAGGGEKGRTDRRRPRAQPRGRGFARTRPGPLEVVFLDWGDTLMVHDQSQPGPMAAWPEVRAVAGAQEALCRLRPQYRLLVATNADDSGERDVLAALSRAGLDGLVDGVVSSRDVGARKPDAVFYRAALLRAGRAGLPLEATRAVMVGDSWSNDVAGAQAVGLRAVWLNPSRARRPAGAAAPDAEIRRLADLPQALAKLSAAAPVARPRHAG
jgi:undecaprenyl-diphosphatase